MKEDIKYPAILKSTINEQVILAYNDSYVYHINGDYKGEYTENYNTDDTRNAGKEVLANTYGKVESKEHAEFIVELTDGVDFINPTGSSFDGYPCWFCFDDNELYFFLMTSIMLMIAMKN